LKEKSRKIVFINQATGYLTIDIINAFAAHYDKAALIAGSIRVQDIELDKKVRWSKIVKYDRGNPGHKSFSWLLGTFQILFLLLFKFRKYEIFYFTVPPSAYLLSLFLPNKFSVLVFDVYPDVLSIYNLKESGFVYRTWSYLNRKLFKKAHKVYTIGQGMANLLASYMPADDLTIIPLWTGLTKIKTIKKDENKWLRQLELQDKFIVQYSGNIGYTHNVELVVEIAKVLRNDKNIHFLIIGRGKKYNNIQTLIRNYSLTNCTILPFQPDDVLNYSLAAADLGVALLDEKTAYVSLPSKIYNLQAVGVPILGISPPDSELDRHLKLHCNGSCFQQGDMDGIVNYILHMRDHPEERQILAENSINAAASYTPANALKYYFSYVS
jgi:glycosyltransferase involved in cell wall biosynthesis